MELFHKSKYQVVIRRAIFTRRTGHNKSRVPDRESFPTSYAYRQRTGHTSPGYRNLPDELRLGIAQATNARIGNPSRRAQVPAAEVWSGVASKSSTPSELASDGKRIEKKTNMATCKSHHPTNGIRSLLGSELL
jgi:hypothetical protein